MNTLKEAELKLREYVAGLERENAELREERDILAGQLSERCNRIVEVNEENYDLRERIAKLEAVLSRFKHVKQINGGAFLYEMFNAEELAALESE